jgi:hypothetical protein
MGLNGTFSQHSHVHHRYCYPGFDSNAAFSTALFRPTNAATIQSASANTTELGNPPVLAGVGSATLLSKI